MKLVDATDNTVMTRTFSKVFGLGGMRIGWCYAPPAVVDVLNRVRGPFNVSVAAQAAAIAALAEPGWVEKGRDHNADWRPKLAAGLAAAGIKVWPSEGNFVLADFGAPEKAEAADAFLRKRGIIVRGVRGYGLPHCLRITVGTGGRGAGGDRRPDRVHARRPWVNSARYTSPVRERSSCEASRVSGRTAGRRAHAPRSPLRGDLLAPVGTCHA